MSDTSMVPRKRDGDRPARRPLIDEELADQLLGKAQAEGPSCADAACRRPVVGRAATEGKDYVMHDSDVVEFRFNVWSFRRAARQP